ncbi:MAG: CPBP family intramembrane glutamic endopeptidase [Planctomycetota bacterium]|nr:CPBP family intramembrane glutamic endopeptidase [Planctomycetota bacterium]
MTSRQGPRQIVRASLAFHGAMGIIAWIGIQLSDQPHPFGESPGKLLQGLAIGIGIGSLAAAISVLLGKVWSEAKELEDRLSQIFEGCTAMEVLLLALISSVAEELLFRALLQPLLGLTLTSALFGLAHWTGDRRLSAWPLFAMLAGLALGSVANWPTAGLAGAIGAHLALNWIGLTRLSRPASAPHVDAAG